MLFMLLVSTLLSTMVTGSVSHSLSLFQVSPLPIHSLLPSFNSTVTTDLISAKVTTSPLSSLTSTSPVFLLPVSMSTHSVLTPLSTNHLVLATCPVLTMPPYRLPLTLILLKLTYTSGPSIIMC